MVGEFIGAAFPWIIMGLFVAISCSLIPLNPGESE